jgi:hypothetical protein
MIAARMSLKPVGDGQPELQDIRRAPLFLGPAIEIGHGQGVIALRHLPADEQAIEVIHHPLDAAFDLIFGHGAPPTRMSRRTVLVLLTKRTAKDGLASRIARKRSKAGSDSTKELPAMIVQKPSRSNVQVA